MDWAALDPYLTFRDAALGYMADLSVLRGASCPTRMTITRARGTLRNVRGTLVAGGIRVRTFHLPEKCQPVTGLAVTGPHVFVAAAGQGTLHVLDTATGRHVASLTHRPSGDGRAEVSCVAAMPNTGEVIVGTRSGRGGFLQCFRTGRHAWAWDTGAGVPVACGGCPGVAMALLDTGVLVGYDPLAGGREEFRLVATGSRVLPGACMKCVESASGKWHAAVVALTERAAR